MSTFFSRGYRVRVADVVKLNRPGYFSRTLIKIGTAKDVTSANALLGTLAFILIILSLVLFNISAVYSSPPQEIRTTGIYSPEASRSKNNNPQS